MVYVIEKQAGKFECRQHPPQPDDDLGPITAVCSGKKCMGWRWRPIMATKAFVAALEKAAADLGMKPDALSGPNSARAHKHLKENAAKFGFSFELTEGYCGYAGEPKANQIEKR